MEHYLIKERKLDADLLAKMGVTLTGDGARFGYHRDGKLYAEKVRQDGKSFHSTGGSLTLYNVDCLDQEGPVVITEGEIDCISVIQAGFGKAVSVPNGWLKDAAKSDALIEHIDALKAAEYVIVAGDNDAAGSSLPKYVSNLLTGQDVRFVTWPKGCKDANDVLMKFGVEALYNSLCSAIQIDPEGGYITSMSDLPPLSARRVLRANIPFVDERVAWELGAMSVVTGYPGCGKSTLTTWLAYLIAKNENIKVGMFSFETHPYRTRDHLCRIITRKGWDETTDQGRRTTIEDGDKHFRFVHRTFETNKGHNLGWLLENIEVLATRDGCKVIIVDPWNELEHMPEPGESLTNYINFALQQIRGIAEKLEVHIVVVAHPKKPNGDNLKIPGGYDIADSAAFYNKPSLGISIGSVMEGDVEQLSLSTWKVRDTQLYNIEKGSTQIEFHKSLMTYGKTGNNAWEDRV